FRKRRSMENDPKNSMERWLKMLRVDSLCQWDVLVFLYRHLASLASAEYIAHLLGYQTSAVVAAVNGLELAGLVQRSRVSQGVRLYQFAVPEHSPQRQAFNHLMALSDSRAGRLLLLQKLRRNEKMASPPSHSQKIRSKIWPQVIKSKQASSA